MSFRTPVLLVEGDRQFAVSLAHELTADGFCVELAHSAPQGRARALAHVPEIVLLGRLASCEAGELIAEIHDSEAAGGWNLAVPVVVLGEEAGGLEALRAFDAGADDFVARPLSYLELRARLRAALRRGVPRAAPGVLQAGALRIDVSARRASVGGLELELSRTEFDLLAHLAGAPKRVVSRDELLRSTWRHPSRVATRTVDTHACRLRRKLSDASGERWITGVRGVGYRLI